MSVELASAYVQILPSFKGIKGHLTTGLAEPLSTVGDKAGATAGKRYAGKFAKAAGVGIGLGLAAVFKTGFDETKDASAGTAQLEAGIKSTGNAAHVSVKGMNNLAGSIQGFSGQTDDSIVKAEQLLLTFTNIKNEGPDKIFDQATLASANMAAKMGGDASSNAIRLGKALNDPVKGISALSKVGVSFTAGQKKQVAQMVKTGDTVGAQKLILGELNKEFGGAAKAAGKSLPGQLARAKRSFEDVSQQIVTGLLPVILTVVSFIRDKLMPIFKTVVDFITRHKTVFLILGATILTIVVALKAWAVIQAVMNILLLTNPVVLIVAGLVALGVALVIAYKKSATFRAIVQGAFEGIKKVVSVVWPILKGIFDVWKQQFIIIGKGAMFLWHHVIEPAATGISTAWGWIKGGLSDAWDFVSGIFGKIKTGIEGVRSFVETVIHKLNHAFRWIGSGLQWAWDNTVGRIFGLIMGAIQKIKDAYDWLFGPGGPAKSVPAGAKKGGALGGVDLSGNPMINPGGAGSGAWGTMPGRAMGGPVKAGQPYVVGEHRRELFVPNENGRILPKVPGWGGGSSTTTFNIINPLPTTTQVGGLDALRRKAEQLGRRG